VPFGEYGAPKGYVTLMGAARRLRVAKGTAQLPARDGYLPTYRDQRDKRARLAKVEDVERLARPVPVE
jgi:hypothetical protein